jgi:hypothetical protein
MSPPAPSRRGLPAREPKPPSEREWERSRVLEPLSAPRRPLLISDGGGLPFAPTELDGPPHTLDPEDPPVATLLAHLMARAAPKPAGGPPWKRRAATNPPPASLDGWRLLARSDDEALFGRGQPPRLVTVAVRLDARRRWTFVASSAARPLRATRDGIRASSWRPDPTREPQPDDTILRVLVTEQTFSGGQRADSRVLAPDLHLDADQLVLTVYVTPRQGYVGGARNPETPIRVELPEPLGLRRLIDGALAELDPQK